MVYRLAITENSAVRTATNVADIVNTP